MNKVRDKKEEKEEAPKSAKAAAPSKTRLPRGFINVLNGSFLTRENVLGNMPFILFCAGLMIVYIAYGYQTERIVRELDHTGGELKELRSEYITVRSQLEKTEQQSQVASGIGALGLEESMVPPVKIAVEQEQLENTRGK
ncbi:MAG: FtsL-like putative cell division protein [Bacteroidota bacterium]|nr:FtsL-like putative cell division protein [Bacteroidota bacterium]